MSTETLHAYPMTDISAVWTFKKTGPNQEPLTIQIVEASSSPLECILGFHSSTSFFWCPFFIVLTVSTACVMNFISSDTAYSLYPIATFENRSSLGMPSSQSSPEAIRKYVRRGWRIYFTPPPSDVADPEASPFSLGYARWVTDAHTWIMPLDQTGVQARPPLSRTSAPLTCDPVRFNGWWVAQRPKMDVYECHYYPVHTTVFRYNYALPNEETSFAMRGWAHQQGKYSHGQVSKEDWIWCVSRSVMELGADAM